MALPAGTRVGPYRIVALIGSGGMGDVYRARDPRLDRDVAIKFLRRARDRRALDRFEKEARAVASLAHPNALAVFDVGDEDGVPYIVTELLPGTTLRKHLRGRLPADEALRIVRQIADVLVAAHDKGIVHRDLKPENIFLLPDGTVKLIDFGLAHHVASSPDAETRETLKTGSVGGTFAYMAPEQIRGLACDGRTDLFALAIVLYEMLAGARPFTGATWADVTTAILTAEPNPLPAGTELPALDTILRRALKKNPGERFSSIKEFAAALDASFDAVPGDHRIPAPGSRTPAQGPTHSVAVLPFVDLSAQRDHQFFCDGMAEEILNALARLPGLRLPSASRSFRFRGQDVDAQSAAAALGVESILEGSVRSAGQRLRVAARLVDGEDGRLLWSEQFDRDVADVFAVQDEIARMVVTALKPKLVSALPTRVIPSLTHNPDAYALYLKGRFHWNKRTERGFLDSIGCFVEARAIDPQFARAAAGLADVYAMLGIHGLRPPAEVMPHVSVAALEALALDNTLAEAHASLALVRGVYEWDRDDARNHFEQMLQLDPHYAAGLQSYAVHGLAPLGRLDEAIDLLRRAIAIDPVSLPINSTLGFVLGLADRAGEGIAVLRRALDLEPHPLTHFFLGNTLAEVGDSSVAIDHLRKAKALSDRPAILAALGYAQAKNGDEDSARAVLAELETQAERRYVSPVGAARIHVALNEVDRALDALEEGARTRATDLTWIRVEPPFRPLAGQPRFVALLQRLHLAAVPTDAVTQLSDAAVQHA
jgi:serine/threonine-protein kinase